MFETSATASGLSGQIRVGPQVAAELRGWKVSLAAKLPRTYSVRVGVAKWDDFWKTQEPWTLRLELGNTIWEWTNVEPIDREGDDVLTFEVRSAPTVIRFAVPQQGEA